MQIVINIKKREWEYLNKLVENGDQLGHYERLLVNGTPLPKGHGRLIDIDLLRDQVSHDEREAFSKHQVWLLLSVHNKKIPTILGADRGE